MYNTILNRDILLFVLAGTFICICIWAYTRSIAITFATLMEVGLTIVVAYFFYAVVCRCVGV